MSRKSPNLLAFCAALAYLILGLSWIAVSDAVVAASSDSVSELTYLQTLKGWGYVASSALLTFLIVRALLVRDRRLRHSTARLRVIFANTPVGIALLDAAGRCVLTNPAFDRKLGLPSSEVQGRPLSQLFDLSNAPNSPALSTQTDSHELQHRQADGTRLNLRLERIDLQGLAPARHPDATALVIVEDITARREREAHRRLSAVTFETPTPTLVTDPNGVIVQINRAYLQMTGHRPEEVIGRTPRVFSSGTHDGAFYKGFWESLRTRGHWEGEMVNRRADGSHFPVWQTINAVIDDAGQTLHYVADVTDLSERRTFEREMHRLEHFDPLTNLPNRRHFIACIEARTPEPGCPATESVLLVDLDAFRKINDALGPSRGDALLREVGLILCAVQPDMTALARISADTFGLILQKPVDDLRGIVEALQQRLAAVPATLGSDFPLTASVGAASLAVCPEATERDPITILAHAATALHHAKEKGPGSYRVFESTMQSAAEARLALAAALKKAIADGSIVPYFQPLRDCRGKIVGAEALARWIKADGQLVSPGEFIPLAEELGYIGDLGEVILGHVARLAATLNAQGTPVNLSVNVSAQHLRDPCFVDRSLAIVTNAGAEPAQITLEVTESLVIGDYGVAAQRLGTLQSLGFRIAIDDFGTGYSSLSYLRELPIDELKIDGSFLRGAVGDPRGERLFESVVSIGRTLGLMVVAEGVETEADAALASRDPDVLLQGYLFGRPTPEAEFLRLFDESRRNGKSRTDLRLAAVTAPDPRVERAAREA